MLKTIILKYAGRCADCGRDLQPGDRAKWYGHGRVYGLDCHTRDYGENVSGSVQQVYSPVSGESWTSCNCEDYPCCGH